MTCLIRWVPVSVAALQALSTCLTAAALLTISPAIAAAGLAVQDPPSYGPWSFYNMTPYLVELSLEYSPENPLNPSDTCYNSIGGTDAGRYFVYPSPRGQCQVVNIHATALEAPTKPGGNPTIVSTSDWQPTGILSTAFNTWVVMQVQDGTPTGSLKIAEVVDSAQPS
jgi:hypothetical protein